MEEEKIKSRRWFIITHRDKCSLCGKTFDKIENAYYGETEDGTPVISCETCNCKLQHSEPIGNKKGCNSIPMPQAKLWRYMDLSKFLSLLEDSSLFFTRIDHFQDAFEGSLGCKQNEDAWVRYEISKRETFLTIENKEKGIEMDNSEIHAQAEENFANFRRRLNNWRTMHHVSCWYQSDTESEAMWNLYTRDSKQGIAIQTTFDRLYQTLPAIPQVDFGMVNYIDYNKYNNGTSKEQFDIFDAVWYKRKSFEHEKEFRAVITDERSPACRDWNKTIHIDLMKLIENIYISPTVDEWFAELVKSIVRNRYNLPINIKQSELNDLPFH